MCTGTGFRPVIVGAPSGNLSSGRRTGKETKLPNAGTHAIAGSATAVAAWIADRRNAESAIRVQDLIVVALVGYVGGLVADLIEPATSPNHRGFAHSIVVAVGLIATMIWLAGRSAGSADGHTPLLKCFVSAYLSHLFMDARTPKGLPIC